MKRSSRSPSSSAAGSSRRSVGVISTSACRRRSCATVIAVATSFCWPRESTSLAGRPCRAPGDVGRVRGAESVSEGVLLAPPPVVVKLDRKPAERGHGVVPVRLQLIEKARAGYGDRLAETRQLRLPRRRIRPRQLEGGIALPEYSVVSDPGLDEGRFHVEHRPVEPPSTSIPAFLHETVDSRLDHLNREFPRELSE